MKLALNIPSLGGTTTSNLPAPPGFRFSGPNSSFGTVLTDVYQVVFLAAAFVMVFWLFWGIYQYLFAGGNKEQLAKARQRITWAIAGFIFIIIAFALSQVLGNVYEQKLPGGVTTIQNP